MSRARELANLGTIGTAISSSADATALTIDSNEKIGIGTASPDRNLHIKQNTATGAEVALTLEGEHNKFKIGVYDFVAGTDSFFIHSHQQSAEVVHINGATGNIGILTPSPEDELDIAGTLHLRAPDNGTNSAIKIRQGNSITNGWDLMLDTNVNGWLYLDSVEAGTHTPRVTFDKGTGNVGIGITIPNENLHIEAADQGVNCRVAYNSSYYTNYGYYIINAVGNPLVFSTEGTERMRVTSAGAIIGPAAGSALYFGDGDTGFHESSDDTLKVKAAGNTLFTFQGNEQRFRGDPTGSPNLYHNAGAEATPVYSFNDDDDTGMWRAGANELAFSTNAIEKMRISSGGRIRFTSEGSGSGEQDARLEWWNENGAGIMGKISCVREGAAYAPGALAFYTSANVDTAANSSEGDWAERLRISSTGVVTPGGNGTQDLGATGSRWANLWVNDLQLSNEGKEGGNEIDGTTGDWTIQEGEEDLFVINRKTGKKFKMNLTEI